MTKKNTHPQREKTVAMRFHEKRVEGGGCWEWTSAIGSRGYGIFWAGPVRRNVMAHRFAYELHNGVMPPVDLVVMHSCDNPRCVNPAHLSLGTNKSNSEDAVAKGRYAVGERNGGGRKLTAQAAREIYASKALINGPQTALKYGVTRHVVNAIRRGEIWQSATRAMQHG